MSQEQFHVQYSRATPLMIAHAAYHIPVKVKEGSNPWLGMMCALYMPELKAVELS